METGTAARTGGDTRFLRAAALLLLLAALVTWSVTLANGFHEDDFHSIVDNPHLRSLGSVPRYFTDPTTFDRHPQNAMVRPFLLVTYALQYACGADSPAFFLGWNVLNHLANAALVFLLAREMARRAAARGGDSVALLAAALFALHPAQTEAVNLVHARSDLLSTSFVLAATWLFLRRSGAVTDAAALVAGALAMLTKESAVVLPVLFLAADAAAPGSLRGKALLASSRRAIPLFVLSGLYLYYRSALLGSIGVDLSAARFAGAAGAGDPWAGGERSILTNLLTQAKVVSLYLGLWAAPFPGRFSAAHDVAPAASLADPAVLAAIAFLVAVAAGAFFLARRRRTPLPIAALVFAAAALAPTSSLVPLNVIMAERRLYLASFALALVTAAALARVPAGRTARARLAAALAAALATVTALRSRDFRDEATLWAAAARTSPGSPRAWTNYGNAMLDAGEPAAAAERYERAIAIRPRDFLAHANRGTALQAVAESARDLALFEAAAASYDRAIELAPRAAVLRHKLGRCRLAAARTAGGGEPAYLAAAAAFEGILETYPEDGLALVFLAGCYREAARPDGLLAAAERLASRHPARLDFRALRAEALVETGRADEAVALFRELTALRPEDPLAYRGLAAALRRAPSPDEGGALEAEAAANRIEARRAGPRGESPAEPPRDGGGPR